MSVLTIDKEKAVKIYNGSDAYRKDLMHELFGKKEFLQPITERVKSFEDACEVLNISPSSVFNSNDAADDIAFKKLKIITRVLNEGWEPNWENKNEEKYFHWWNLNGGFRLYLVYYYFTYSFVGSRLCFKSRELAEYTAKQFLDLYKAYHTS